MRWIDSFRSESTSDADFVRASSMHPLDGDHTRSFVSVQANQSMLIGECGRDDGESFPTSATNQIRENQQRLAKIGYLDAVAILALQENNVLALDTLGHLLHNNSVMQSQLHHVSVLYVVFDQ